MERIRYQGGDMDLNAGLPTVSPKSLARLRQLMTRYSSSMGDIVETTYSDPGLTVWAISRANAEEFGFQKKIAGIPEALVIIGFVRLRNFACQRRQFNTHSGQQWTGEYIEAAKIAVSAGRWARLLGETAFGLCVDALRTTINCWIGAVTMVSVEKHRRCRPEPDALASTPIDFRANVNACFEQWRIPEQFAAYARAISVREGDDDYWSHDLTSVDLAARFILETALRLASAKLLDDIDIKAVFHSSPIWQKLDKSLQDRLIAAGETHVISRIDAVSSIPHKR